MTITDRRRRTRALLAQHRLDVQFSRGADYDALRIWRIGRELATLQDEQGYLALGFPSFISWFASRGYPIPFSWTDSLCIPVYRSFKYAELRGTRIDLKRLSALLGRRRRLPAANPPKPPRKPPSPEAVARVLVRLGRHARTAEEHTAVQQALRFFCEKLGIAFPGERAPLC